MLKKKLSAIKQDWALLLLSVALAFALWCYVKHEKRNGALWPREVPAFIERETD